MLRIKLFLSTICDYSLPSSLNSTSVVVMACILGFNKSVEYHQAANTVITRPLPLFDKSIFHLSANAIAHTHVGGVQGEDKGQQLDLDFFFNT